jgi:hypothetical protein
MKKIVILTLGLVVFFSIDLYAQKDRIIYQENFDKNKLHFGYYLGLNQKSFIIKYDPLNSSVPINTLNTDYIEVEESLGFNIGLVVDYKLHDNINLRFEPGLSSNTKNLTFSPDIAAVAADNEREVPGTYLRLPLLLKFSTNRLDNMRAFVIGGVSYDYNFSSNQNNTQDNETGNQFRMKTGNFMYEVGVGVDIYLLWFKFSPSIRGIFAINNELVPDVSINSPYTSPIDYLGTRGVFINFTFE